MRFLGVFITILFISSLGFAQDPVAIANARGSNLIDSTMATINLRAERFNEEVGKVNMLKALDITSFGKDTIKMNKQKIKDFLEYLEVYRSLSEALMQATEDSVKELRTLMPRSEKEKFLKDFLEAYEMDQKSFDLYTLALTKVFTNVIKVLDYLETAKIEIKDNKVFFFDKKESEQYSKLFEAVELSQKKLATAGANSQKARIDAGMRMQKAYGQVKK